MKQIGGVYDLKLSRDRMVPSNLGEAAQLFKASEAAKNLFGESFVNHSQTLELGNLMNIKNIF